ncbi:MAG: VacJ family lipoprotein [Alphaproteobacteria bacterium]|nr:VacJ family lipoprotein [Alphaproteobacteria bacterium]MDE1986416.1 VacJ family lipoprotein [Alphaproteobacteria bacterium]MDE2162780.1 VacJ family lipoprotein [Alphaproteobacteria bacterium]MDE2266283.1 VacJ family lipoprotein [Alphaproteobacteria bacterium]MDE2499161.1 VacJ family lipoprotein [Alphaproteobacteria bacterium]
MPHRSSILAVALLSVLAAGCTTTTDPEALAQNDPYEPTNRTIFDMNTKVQDAVAKPVAKFYNHAVPEFARDGVHNFLTNLDKPVTFGNDILQGDADRAGETLERFTVNSTLGVGGLVDVATKIGIPDHTSDFGVTLGTWGVDSGPYLVLPFLGPDSPRDLSGQVADIFMDPLTYIKFHGSDTWYAVRSGVGVLDLYSQNVDTLDQIERSSIDYYATMRSLYQQHRNAEIHHDQPDIQDTPGL